jgi:hypothetical protein
MYGQVVVDDDFDDDGERDYQFDGWEIKAVAAVKPRVLEFGFRYDEFTDEYYGNGAEDNYRTYTLGVNYLTPRDIRLQLNYKYKRLESDVDLDLDENSLIFAAQLEI